MLISYPSLMLTVRGGMNGVFILALVSSLVAWPFTWRDDGLYTRQDIERYAWAMFGLTIAIFISESYWQDYSGPSYDAAARYWLAIPIFLWLSRKEPEVFHAMQIAFPVAAIAGFLLAVDVWGRSGISTLDLIHFGDMELMLGILSLFSINWFGRDSAALRLLKVAGFVAGVAASFSSGSRGGWLAIPVFFLLYLYFNRNRVPFRMMAGVTFLTCASMVGLYMFNTTVNVRVGNMLSDIREYREGNRDTSIGIRWQLYGAALDIFSRHPIVGVGPSGFAHEMEPMAKAGKLTQEAANLGRGEVHNDMLSKAAGMGLFGLAAILALYLVPIRMFRKATLSSIREVRRTGILGVTFVSGTAVFGLTVEFLNLTLAAAFYAFTVAVLLAACHSLGNNKLSTQHEQHEPTP
jgi:O-antigen ligase